LFHQAAINLNYSSEMSNNNEQMVKRLIDQKKYDLPLTAFALLTRGGFLVPRGGFQGSKARFSLPVVVVRD
jgi:hypothetical protein